MPSDYGSAVSRKNWEKHGERPSLLDWPGAGFADQVGAGLNSLHAFMGGILQIPPARTTTLSQAVTANASPQSVAVVDSSVFTVNDTAYLDYAPNYEEITITAIADATHITAVFSKSHATGVHIFISTASTSFPSDCSTWDTRGGSFKLERGNANAPVTQMDRHHPLLHLYVKNDAVVPGYDPGELNPWGYCPAMRIDVESTSGGVTAPHGGLFIAMDWIDGVAWAKTTAPITGSGSPQTIEVDSVSPIREDAAMSVAWGQSNADAATVTIIDPTHVRGTFAGTYPVGTLIGLPFQGDKIGLGVELSDVAGSRVNLCAANLNVTAKSQESVIISGSEVDCTNAAKCQPGYFGNGPLITGFSIVASGGTQQTTLASTIDDTTGTIPLSSAGDIWNGSEIVIDAEIMHVISGAGTTSLTVTRAYRGSLAASHTAGVIITLQAVSTQAVGISPGAPGSLFYYGLCVGAAREAGLIIQDAGAGAPTVGIQITGAVDYCIVCGSDQTQLQQNYPEPRDPHYAAILLTHRKDLTTQSQTFRFQYTDAVPATHSYDLSVNNLTGLTVNIDGTWNGFAQNPDGGVDSQKAFRLRDSGNVYISGFQNTSGVAQIFLKSGTLLAVPTVGMVENDGAHLYYTNNSGVRSTLGGGSIIIDSGYASLPPSANDMALGGGGTTPNAISACFGDGSGWKWNIGYKSGSSFVPTIVLVDNGEIDAAKFIVPGITKDRPVGTNATTGEFTVRRVKIANSNDADVAGLTTGEVICCDGSTLVSLSTAQLQSAANCYDKSNTYNKTEVYSKSEVDALLAALNFATHGTYYVGGSPPSVMI